MNLEGIYMFGALVSLAVGFVCLQMGVAPWKLWFYDSHTERDS